MSENNPATSPVGGDRSRVRTAMIIGGGIAGPVTATALAKAGIEAAVYEAYPEPSQGIGGSLALAPNGMAALEIIGAADAVRGHALPITASALSVSDRPLGATPRLSDLEPLQMIERGQLHEVLRGVAREAGVPLVHGRRLVGVDEHADGITARFEDGSTATADVLIGADGARSTVRALIDPKAPAADYTGMLGFEGYVPADALPAGLDVGQEGEMVFAFGRRAYYLYWPVPGGVSWGVNLPSETYLSRNDARKTTANEWLEIIRQRYAGDRPESRSRRGDLTRHTPDHGRAPHHAACPALVSRPDGGGRRRRARPLQQHRPRRVTRDRELDRARPLPPGPARPGVGVRGVRETAARAGGDDHTTWRQAQPRQDARADRPRADARAVADDAEADQHDRGAGSGAALQD